MAKKILYLLLIILFIGSSIPVIVNIMNFKKKPIDIGIVYKISDYTLSGGSNSRNIYKREFYIKNKKEFKGSYNHKKQFNIEVGDSITFRRMDFSNTIRALKKNDKELQGYYGVWDYLSSIIVITMVLGYFFIPKFFKKIKQQHNEKLFENYYR